MDALLAELANALERVVRDDLAVEQFRRQFSERAVTPSLERIMAHVEHFLSDADIRERDAGYKQKQEASMRRLIDALRSGDVAGASSITFLGP